MTIIQPLTESPESDDVAVRYRSNRDFYHYNGSNWEAYKRVGTVGTGAGGDVVTLNGRLFTIEQAGTDYRDGFQIVDRKPILLLLHMSPQPVLPQIIHIHIHCCL